MSGDFSPFLIKGVFLHLFGSINPRPSASQAQYSTFCSHMNGAGKNARIAMAIRNVASHGIISLVSVSYTHLHSDLSEEQLLALSDAFAQGNSGNLRVKLSDTSYYLVYESTVVQNWTLLGLVPVRIVNASLDRLWFHTVRIAAGIAVGFAVLVILLIVRKSHVTLRRKNTEISYRDELFQKLSMNVDDVFLMLDAKTSKVDYVSPNICLLYTSATEEPDIIFNRMCFSR